MMPGDRTQCISTCIVEPYNASRANRGKVVTFICVRSRAHSRNAWTENIANVWFPYTNMGKTLGGISRYELKKNLFLVLNHSACPYKNYCLKCFLMFQTYFVLFFFYLFSILFCWNTFQYQRHYYTLIEGRGEAL